MLRVNPEPGSATPPFPKSLAASRRPVVGQQGSCRAAACPSCLALPQLLPVTHSGTPSPVQGCAKPRRGMLPRQTSQAVPWCALLSRSLQVPLQTSFLLPHALSGSYAGSPCSFCHPSPAKGVECAIGVCFVHQVM